MKEKIHEKISQNIKRFDLYSLLKLLESIGYKREDIHFESNLSQASYTSICQAIVFSDHPPKVTITLNIGLLSTSSSLPSFFLKYIETEEVNSPAFIRFLNFFNHHLLDLLLEMVVPERNRAFFVNWKQTQLHYLSLLGFESISTLWFLMKICFPDLVVEVTKNPQKRYLYTSSLVLGRDGLGAHSYLGKSLKQTLSSFKVTFTTEEEMSELGVPWPIEINRRLNELVFPVLKKTDIHLSIILVIKNKYGYATLGPKTYLGFERLWKNRHPFQLLLFYGLIKNLKRSAYLASS